MFKHSHLLWRCFLSLFRLFIIVFEWSWLFLGLQPFVFCWRNIWKHYDWMVLQEFPWSKKNNLNVLSTRPLSIGPRGNGAFAALPLGNALVFILHRGNKGNCLHAPGHCFSMIQRGNGAIAFMLLGIASVLVLDRGIRCDCLHAPGHCLGVDTNQRHEAIASMLLSI